MHYFLSYRFENQGLKTLNSLPKTSQVTKSRFEFPWEDMFANFPKTGIYFTPVPKESDYFGMRESQGFMFWETISDRK